MSTKIGIILPCYNPEQHWLENVIANFKQIQESFAAITFELIIANDGSTKNVNTQNLSNDKRFTFINSPYNEGKGAILRKGIIACQADFYVYTDIDFPYTNESTIAIIRTLISGNCTIAAGVRNSEYYKNVPLFRQRLSKFLRYTVAKSFNLKIDDTQCGLKGFDNKGKAIFLQTKINRYLFDLEFIFLASNTDAITISPVPVKLKEGIIFRKINTKIMLTEGLNFLKIIFRL